MVLGLVLAAPLAFNLRLIATYGVNTPVFDQWWMGYQFAQITTHGFDREYVFRQANESRPAVPLLVSYALAQFTHWNSKVEMVLSQALICLTAVGLFALGRRTLEVSWPVAVALAGLSAALLLSPVQDQSLLWGIQAILYYPAACLVGCLLITGTGWRVSTQVAACIALCWIATYSYANGMSLWLLVPWLFLVHWRRGTPLTRAATILAWMAAAGMTVWAYFDGYARPKNHPALDQAFAHATDAAKSFVLYLGAPLSAGSNQADWAFAIGIVMLIVIGSMLAWLGLSPRGRRVLPRSLPWLVFMAYGLVAGVAIVAGRLGFGVSYALASRYVAFSSCVYAAIFSLVAIWLREAAPATRRVLVPLSVATALLIVALHVGSIRAVLPNYRDLRTARLQSKAATWLIPVLPYPMLGPKITLYMADEGARPIFEQVNRLGWLPSGLLQDFRRGIVDATGSPRFGRVEQLSTDDGSVFRLSGWCVLAGRDEPCHAVLITAAFATGDERACGVLFPSVHRPDVEVTGGSTRLHGWAGWSTCPDAVRLLVWSVDAEARALNLLPQPR